MNYDVSISSCKLYFLPVTTRTPYKFGSQTLSEVTCARVWLEVVDTKGSRIGGWGETPLSAQWAWPSSEGVQERIAGMKAFCRLLGKELCNYEKRGHPIEICHGFQEEEFHELRKSEEIGVPGGISYLAGLVCLSAFDIALHDAYANLHRVPVYETYKKPYMNQDLSAYLEPADDVDVSFVGQYPNDYLEKNPPSRIPAWHSVGAGDPLTSADLDGSEPNDAYPRTLEEWIKRDSLNCLKIKLSGQDWEHDYKRIVAIGEMAKAFDCEWLCADFNCTVKEVSFITRMLERLSEDAPDTYRRILYVEQPFAYEMEESPMDVNAVSALKPLFMDESAHDWKLVREGRSRGWTGVALKTCKTQTNAVLMQAWASAHTLPLMVQDLTNPMLAQIPHTLLAAHAGTIMGLETNAMQFYPDASSLEALIHPGLYERKDGFLDLSSLCESGFGYRVEEIDRALPEVDSFFE
ncbi:mandelate racemase/muconate lactonizing enzyme family protein [Puniceicoccaceae bacterium K14]|nr:mandelate racemase/muconate lactonizing enzyme family protein [Puniceicoccaceae bacterium K14]